MGANRVPWLGAMGCGAKRSNHAIPFRAGANMGPPTGPRGWVPWAAERSAATTPFPFGRGRTGAPTRFLGETWIACRNLKLMGQGRTGLGRPLGHHVVAASRPQPTAPGPLDHHVVAASRPQPTAPGRSAHHVVAASRPQPTAPGGVVRQLSAAAITGRFGLRWPGFHRQVWRLSRRQRSTITRNSGHQSSRREQCDTISTARL